jgi:hypothetical protein
MENAKIYTAIPAIMDEIGHIGKDKKNQQQGFMFRGIDQVMNAMKPLMTKHGVFAVPEVVDTQRSERTTKSGGNLIYTIHKIKYHFVASDGSEVCATVVGEGMDSADKSSNKAMAVAFKYACFQVFCIPTEEMAKDDPDGYSPESSVPTPTQAELKKYIDNCHTVEDLQDLNTMWGAAIKADPMLSQYGNEAYKALKGGAR